MRLNKIIFLFIVSLMGFSTGCDRDLEIERRLEDTIEENKITIRTLQSQIDQLITEKSDFQARVAELSVEDPDGLAIEEKRKALVAKEAFIQQRENEFSEREARIIELEESNRKQERQLSSTSAQFITDKQNALESIGEARQMRDVYGDLKNQNKLLRQERSEAENRANNWLIWLSVVAFILVISVIIVIVLYIKHRDKAKHIDGAISIIEGGTMPYEERKLIAASLGKTLEERNDTTES